MEVWCLERGIEFSGYGSWTLRNRRARRGAEADACYVFGEAEKPRRPDLAIEVEMRRRHLDKLEVYSRLRVPEVWIWRDGRIAVHRLVGNGYEECEASAQLPGIDLAELASFLAEPIASRAMRAYRDRLRSR